MYVWVVLTLLVCLLPIVIWRAEIVRVRDARSRRAAQAAAAAQAHSVPFAGEVEPA